MQQLFANIVLSAGMLVSLHCGCVRLELEAVGPTPSSDGFQRVASDESRQRVVREAMREQLQNFMQVPQDVFVGGEPSDETAFAGLAELGIRTVVSVDGAAPQVKAAQRHGLRYVHIPIGYDGVSRHAALSLAQLVMSAERPFYIHCHHGRHRGPAVAGIVCRASGSKDEQSALDILRRAGTSKQYAGLWRDVAAYQCPPPGAELPELVSAAEVDSMAASMALIDRATKNLVLCELTNWNTPPEHPDIAAAHESLLLKEGFREAVRELVKSQKNDAKFVAWMKKAEHTADELDQALQAGDSVRAGNIIKTLREQCTSCHNAYRNMSVH